MAMSACESTALAPSSRSKPQRPHLPAPSPHLPRRAADLCALTFGVKALALPSFVQQLVVATLLTKEEGETLPKRARVLLEANTTSAGELDALLGGSSWKVVRPKLKELLVAKGHKLNGTRGGLGADERGGRGAREDGGEEGREAMGRC